MFDRVMYLQQMLIDLATNGSSFEESKYIELRKELMENASLKHFMPDFIRNSRTQGALWSYFKSISSHWQPRREHIETSFRELLEYIENNNYTPIHIQIAEALTSFGTDGIERAWGKALERRETDPEGAITAARTLLETVCKQILDKYSVIYSEKDDLPKLYHETALLLNLAPSLHTEEIFKTILGNCQSVVNNLGTLRNKIGDAHGQGGKPIKPAQRHAALAVNLAGSIATFLVETYRFRTNT